MKLKIREKHSDCNLTNLTYSYHFRSKSETTTDLFSFVKVRQNFEDTKFILLKIVKILKFLQYSRDGSQVHRANMHNPSISFMVSFITLFTKDVNSCSVNMILFRFIFFIFFGYKYLSYCKYTTTFSNIQLFIEK